MFVELESADKKLLGDRTDILCGYNRLNGLRLNPSQQILLIFSSPGSVAEKHLIENDPQGPDVRLERILIFPEGLRRHVKRRSHVVLIRFW